MKIDFLYIIYIKTEDIGIERNIQQTEAHVDESEDDYSEADINEASVGNRHNIG